jgi:hypothetical protein
MIRRRGAARGRERLARAKPQRFGCIKLAPRAAFFFGSNFAGPPRDAGEFRWAGFEVNATAAVAADDPREAARVRLPEPASLGIFAGG